MKEIWNWIHLSITAFGGWLGWFFGGLDGLLLALVIIVVIDYISGVMCAIVFKKLSSEVGFRGIFKKVIIFSLVAIGHIIDLHVIGDHGGGQEAVRTAIICFYIVNELVSLLENSARLGLPVPDKLKGVLAQLHNREPANIMPPLPKLEMLQENKTEDNDDETVS